MEKLHGEKRWANIDQLGGYQSGGHQSGGRAKQEACSPSWLAGWQAGQDRMIRASIGIPPPSNGTYRCTIRHSGTFPPLLRHTLQHTMGIEVAHWLA